MFTRGLILRGLPSVGYFSSVSGSRVKSHAQFPVYFQFWPGRMRRTIVAPIDQCHRLADCCGIRRRAPCHSGRPPPLFQLIEIEPSRPFAVGLFPADTDLDKCGDPGAG